MTKVCTQCGEEKSLTEYYKDKHNRFDGYSWKCKSCKRLYRKKHYHENKAYYKEGAKRYKCSIKDAAVELDSKELRKLQLYYKIRDYLNSDGPYWHVDHIVPISKGGLHHPDNIQIIPAGENMAKRDKEDYQIESWCSIRI